MRTRWIIDDSLINRPDREKMLNYLEANGYPYETIKVIPFSEEKLDIAAHEGPTVAYGSTTLIKRVPKEYRWFNENAFRPSHWGSLYKEDYLNSDMQVMKLANADNYVISMMKDKTFFVRPDSDHKLFAGGVFGRGDFIQWYDKLNELINDGTYVNLDMNTYVCISEYKHILKEWRFFVVDKTVVAFSQYKRGSFLHKSTEFDYKAFGLANKIANDKQQLAIGYVVDIALTENNEYKIIEFNNFNSSGFYNCNIEQIIEAASAAAMKEWYHQRKADLLRWPILLGG